MALTSGGFSFSWAKGTLYCASQLSASGSDASRPSDLVGRKDPARIDKVRPFIGSGHRTCEVCRRRPGDGRTYAFIALERIGGVVIDEVTHPLSPSFSYSVVRPIDEARQSSSPARESRRPGCLEGSLGGWISDENNALIALAARHGSYIGAPREARCFRPSGCRRSLAARPARRPLRQSRLSPCVVEWRHHDSLLDPPHALRLAPSDSF